MIHYKKAVYIILIELFAVLAVTSVCAWFYHDGSQFEKVALASLFFCIAAFSGSYFLIESQTKVVVLIFSIIIAAIYFISYTLETFPGQIIVYLVAACVITIFLNTGYILIYGVVTLIVQILAGVFHFSLFNETMSPFHYAMYLACYGLGIYNIYILVRKASETMQRLESASRSKNNFLAAMAHEIRTPMNAILNLSENLAKVDQPEEIIGQIEKIINAGNILLSMTNGILDFTLIESGKYTLNQTAYHTGEMIEEVVDMTKIQLTNKALDFELKKENEIPMWLNGDRMRIWQILLNILSNAVKFTEQGKITLSVGWQGDEEEGKLILSVSDTGRGIMKGDLEHIFGSFTRLDYSPKVEGTGLGLAICRELAAMMGGEIKVESTYHQGSTFTITIPQRVYKKGKSIKAPGARILIVEDTRVNSLLLERLLEPYEVITETVKDGGECLAKLKEKKYDLIIMDYLMPEMDGLETIRFMRRDEEYHAEMMPVVILTTKDEKKLRNEFLAAGCQDFIEKPIETEKLEYILIHYLPQELLRADV